MLRTEYYNGVLDHVDPPKTTAVHCRPLPSTHGPYKMRSALEKRFAAYLDGQHRPYDYEPQRYYDGEISYLPDFELLRTEIGRRWFVEVKPTAHNAQDALRRMHAIRTVHRHAILTVVAPEQLTGKFTTVAVCSGRPSAQCDDCANGVAQMTLPLRAA